MVLKGKVLFSWTLWLAQTRALFITWRYLVWTCLPVTQIRESTLSGIGLGIPFFVGVSGLPKG
jgi:hypothetical protein